MKYITIILCASLLVTGVIFTVHPGWIGCAGGAALGAFTGIILAERKSK